MNILKKFLSILMSVLLISTAFFLMPASAYSEPFDINDYTIVDLQNMGYDERKELLYKFIDTYDPYGIKEMNMYSYNIAQPLWKSDGGEGKGTTHEMITLQAFLCFVNDYGLYNINGAQAVAIALYLSTASGLPDKDEIGATPYAGHFYDPDTQRNWAFSKKNTAKTNAQKHFTNAYNKLKANADIFADSEEFKDVMEELGRALHYVQDACESHHTNNKVAGITNHSEYEKYVDERISTYLKGVDSALTSDYKSARELTVSEYTHKIAVESKPYYKYIKDNYDITYWDLYGMLATISATSYSSGMIYKLFYT